MSAEDTAFVGGYHILDIDKGVFTPGLLKKFKGFHDEITKIDSLALVVVDLISDIEVAVFE